MRIRSLAVKREFYKDRYNQNKVRKWAENIQKVYRKHWNL